MSKDEKKSDAQLLSEKIKDIRIAMLTTVESDGSLYSRPMATQEMDKNHNLWFFTHASAPKVDQVEQHQQVNIGYAKPDKDLFVSVSGTAELVRDRNKIKELWKPLLKTWFPNGEDDPELALLKITIDRAEYWDVPGGKPGLLVGMVKSLAGGSPDSVGEDVKLDIK